MEYNNPECCECGSDLVEEFCHLEPDPIYGCETCGQLMDACGRAWIEPEWRYYQAKDQTLASLMAAMMDKENTKGAMVWIWMLVEAQSGRAYWRVTQKQRNKHGDDWDLAFGVAVIDDFGYLQFVR